MEPGAGLQSAVTLAPAAGGYPACRERGKWGVAGLVRGQGSLIESGFPGELRRKGLVEGLVLQVEDLQL